MFFISSLARSPTLELLDSPECVSSELRSNLRDIRRLNRWFGGTWLVRRYVAAAWKPESRGDVSATGLGGRLVSLLDVGTGSGDIPLELVRWGERHGIAVQATALDRSPEVLAEARRIDRAGCIRFVLGDVRALPWPDDSFDLVTCSLTLHHLDLEAAVQALREMARVARYAVIVTDLRRSRLAYLGTWTVTRLLSRNRMTRNDGPLSVLRAYTVEEARALASQAGLSGARVRRHLFFRLALVWWAGPENVLSV